MCLDNLCAMDTFLVTFNALQLISKEAIQGLEMAQLLKALATLQNIEEAKDRQNISLPRNFQRTCILFQEPTCCAHSLQSY